MTLPATQVEQFYKIWRPLLTFVNEQLKVVSSLSGEGPKDSIDAGNAVKVRDALWKNEKVLEQFIQENSAQLSPEDLKILESWKFRRQGTFIITFGPGIRGNLKDIYDDAKERGAIITSLLPGQNSVSPENQVSQAEATNAKVLEAFQRYQYKSGLNPKTVERDAMNVSAAAQYLLHRQPTPTSMREITQGVVRNYLASLPEKERKTARLSLKRFTSFLQDTGRLDWAEAENLLEELKS